MQLHFTRTNGTVDDAIDRLIQEAGGVQRPEIVRDMLLAALKAGQEDDERADLKLMNTTLKEMRFTPRSSAPTATCARSRSSGLRAPSRTTADLCDGKQFGQKTRPRRDTWSSPAAAAGIMQAANEGAGPEHSFGVNIRLPFEQKPNPVLEGNPRLITYKYFFNRKVAFLKEADAVALFPGGFGTLDEAMETLTLVQTGKRDPLPLVLVDEPGGRIGTGSSSSLPRSSGRTDISMARTLRFSNARRQWKRRSKRSPVSTGATTACGM